MSIDYSKITDIVIDGVDLEDYPDFCDAYIESATYDGRDATEEELDEMNENSAFIYESLIEQLF